MQDNIKDVIYTKILSILDKYLGEMIDERLIAQIKKEIYAVFINYVMTGDIDANKWQADHNIVVAVDTNDPSLLKISIPKWLELWLEDQDEESQAATAISQERQ